MKNNELLNTIDSTYSLSPEEQDKRDWDIMWSWENKLYSLKELFDLIQINDEKKKNCVEFICQDKSITNQWRLQACTAFGTINWANEQLYIQYDSRVRAWEYLDPLKLRDKMWELWLQLFDKNWNPTGAYTVDAVKTAKDIWYIANYYRVAQSFVKDKAVQIANAIYNTHVVVVGTNWIDWRDCYVDWLVKGFASNKQWGHCVVIVWFYITRNLDEYKITFIFENSWGDKYFWINWRFEVPGQLINEWILQNDKFALITEPDWMDKTQDERLNISLENARKFAPLKIGF